MLNDKGIVGRPEPTDDWGSLSGVDFATVADIPVLQRQRILVVSDDVADMARRRLEQNGIPQDRSLRQRIRRRAEKIGDQAVASAVTAVARMKAKDADVLLISRSEAMSLEFTPSHPLSRTVYVAHPIVTTQYFDVAHFHEHLLEGKFAELLRLLSALGATKIEIEQVEGKRSDKAVEAVVKKLGLGVSGKRRSKLLSRSHAVWSSSLPGHRKPRLPTGELAWFPTEPFWQHIAEARIKFGQRDFSLVLKHDQSMGITKELKTALRYAELEAGGELVEQQAVAWNISGEFL